MADVVALFRRKHGSSLMLKKIISRELRSLQLLLRAFGLGNNGQSAIPVKTTSLRVRRKR
jgi:hypothetical protein